MLTAYAKVVLRFPWRLWHLFDDYPRAELSVSLPDYSRSLKQPPTETSTVKILAVLGSDDGIDVETDRQLLERLPSAEVTLLPQPTLDELQQHLWEKSWDVFFFAGHSTSQGQGYLQVNAAESLTIEQLKYALQRAITNGLQLAILNSCDGLGLAWALADLHLPQTIVMREPVSDAIAQQFLKAFLTALASGQSLYLSVREAREKLHGRTELGSYAAWLPSIVQNPSEDPPTWQALRGLSREIPERIEQFATKAPAVALTSQPNDPQVAEDLVPQEQPVRKPDTQRQHPKPHTELYTFTILVARGLAIAVAVFVLRWLGALQNTELKAYDTLMKLRPIEEPDSRLVVVTVDERDIQSQTSLERRGSLSDETLQATLSTLLSYDPRVIGLDVYRDFPATIGPLEKTLSHPKIIGICKSRDPSADDIGIAPAPEFTEIRVGFSDFLEETDGIVRRQLLTATPNPTSPCTSAYGFGALMAIHYLHRAEAGEDSLKPSFDEQGNFRIGETVFPRLPKRAGGLQRIDHRGNQLLLNYRSRPSPDQIAVKIPLEKLLNGEVNAESIRDRLVIIGVTAPSGDYWATPYGVQGADKTPGVFIQAQMISQMISAVLEGRPLMRAWPQWADALCLLGGVIAGSLLVWSQGMRSRQGIRLGLILLVGAGGLVIVAWAALIAGIWLPLVPTFLTFSGGVLSTATVLTASRDP
nr:CHASE2 domain-containing protein [cf. Phormidesmis sp. LEGE 11477]